MTREDAIEILSRRIRDIEESLSYSQHSTRGYQSLYDEREALQIGIDALMTIENIVNPKEDGSLIEEEILDTGLTIVKTYHRKGNLIEWSLKGSNRGLPLGISRPDISTRSETEV